MVGDVLIQGNRLVPTAQIMAQIKTHAGNVYDADKVQEDCRILSATRQFANVSVDVKPAQDGKITVIFTVQDQANLVQHIIYNGAEHLGRSDDDINAITGLRVGMPLDPVSNKLACKAIIAKFNEDGRPFASCQLVRGDKPGDTDVVFNIGEGPVVKISSISFTGNTFVSGAVLGTHVQSSHAILGVLGGKLNAPLVEADIAKLEEYYKSFGYLDVHVSRELHWNDDGLTVALIFHVQEGLRYQVKDKPHVSGAHSFPPEQLEQLTGVKAGQFYNQADVDKDVGPHQGLFRRHRPRGAGPDDTAVRPEDAGRLSGPIRGDRTTAGPRRPSLHRRQRADAGSRHSPSSAGVSGPVAHLSRTCARPSATWSGWASSSRAASM